MSAAEECVRYAKGEVDVTANGLGLQVGSLILSASSA